VPEEAVTAKPTPAAEAAAQPAEAGRAWRLRRESLSTSMRDGGIVVVLIVLFVVLAITTTDTFLTRSNLEDVVDSAAPIGLMAVAGTLVVIAGGFDLSAGAVFTVGAVVGAEICNRTDPVVGIAAGLCAGLVLGVVNGVLCTYGRVNHFVATLATSIVFAGVATLIVGGSVILINDASFANLATTEILGINSSTYIFVIFALACAFLLNRAVFGRQMFATGGNLQAARLAGISIPRIQIVCYAISGGAAALAGMIVSGRSLSVGGNAGDGLIFEVLAAILIGGVSVGGGRGAIWRPVVGVLILQLISNGFNLNGIDPLYQQITSGLIIVGAVIVDVWTRRK
jgi:ribose transport system permease protein